MGTAPRSSPIYAYARAFRTSEWAREVHSNRNRKCIEQAHATVEPSCGSGGAAVAGLATNIVIATTTTTTGSLTSPSQWEWWEEYQPGLNIGTSRPAPHLGFLLVNTFSVKMNLRQPLLKVGSHIRNSRRFSDQISLPGAVSVTDSYPTHTGGQANHIEASSFQNPRAQLEDMNRPVASLASSPPPAQPESSPNRSSESSLNLPSPVIQPTEPPRVHVNPFHTHVFFTALEKTFPSPVARTLMAATRGLLVDRILRIRRESLIAKDLDNVSRQ